MQRLSDEQGACQAEASATTRRLEKTEANLAVLRAELTSERSVRERVNVTVEILRRKLVEEKAGFEEMKLKQMERELEGARAWGSKHQVANGNLRKRGSAGRTLVSF